MRRLSLLILVVLMICSAGKSHGQNNFELGKKYYSLRAKNYKGKKAKLKYINKAINNFNKCEQTPEVISALLRSYEFKGSYTKISRKKAKLVFEKAINLGKESYEKFPDDISIKYYYLSNMGRWAQEISLMTSATNGISKDIRDLAEEVYEKDPYFADAGASRILGVLHMKIPTVPFVVTWPSEDKGIEYLKWAYEKAPENPANVIFYAEAMIESGNESVAKDILKQLKSRKPRTEKLIEDLNSLERVNELCAKHFDESMSF